MFLEIGLLNREICNIGHIMIKHARPERKEGRLDVF